FKTITPPTTRLSSNVCQQLKPLGLIVDDSVTIGRNLMFERGAKLYPGCSALRLKIGSYSYSSPNSHLTTVSIGRYCSIGHAVEFGLGEHKFRGLTTSPSIQHNRAFMDYSGFIPISRDSKRPDGEETSVVTLGHDIWVGCHCLFPKDVTIGHGAVIGAGSIITHDVPPYAIVAGTGGGENSKGIIKGYRFPDEIISDLLELAWWNYDIPQMVAQGIKVPLHNINDFITFMKNEEREHLIPLPEAWYYLNVLNSNSVQLYCVDPDQSFMGSILDPAKIAIIDSPVLAQAQAQAKAVAQAKAQKAAAVQAEEQELARSQAQAMMFARSQTPK
ncbi:MAG: CatB-related O-acetyltransferase, partial [Anaerobiospirillum sp.]|nr:CatB-related O-acetyltransferase [Anaerobiospirillum sp.]